jgi:general secretion pathway protein N
MRHLRLLVAVGLVALLVSLVALLPARVGLSLLRVPATTLTGVSGSLWHGAGQRLTVGSLTLGPIHWQVKPTRLLMGQLAADVGATLPDGFLNATVGWSLRGRLGISGLEAAAPLGWLAPAMGGAGSQLTARFDRLVVNAGHVETAIGSLQVAGVVLPVPTTGPNLGAGTYEVAFNADGLKPGVPLTGTVKDSGGPLEIAGTVTLTPPRSYELTGTAKPRPNAPPELLNALKMLGPATPDGGHALSLAGSF